MRDEDKTKDQLVHELSQLRQQVAHVQIVGGEPTPVDEGLGDSEAKYRLLVKNLPNVVFKGYKDWTVDFIDDKIESLTGYPKEDFDALSDEVAGYCIQRRYRRYAKQTD